MPEKKERATRNRKAGKPLAFVIMPYEKASPSKKKLKYERIDKEELDEIFGIMKRALQYHGYDVKREVSAGDIVRGIILDLDQADLVVADLTGLNPNVMYELGIRHTFTKKTIILTQDRTELPFDLKNHHAIEYGWKTNPKKREFRKNLNQTLSEIESGKDVRFGPVHVHIGARKLGVIEYERRRIFKKLTAVARELSQTHGLFASFAKTIKVDDSPVFEVSEPTASVPFEMRFSVKYLGGRQIEEDVENQIASRFEIAMILPYSMPALDLLVAEDYLSWEFADVDAILAFTIMAGSLRRDLLERRRKITLKFFLDSINKIQILLKDVQVLMRAVVHNSINEKLRLGSQEISSES